MPFNASGLLQRLFSWRDDRDAGVKILAERMDQEMDGIVAGINELVDGTVNFQGPVKTINGTAANPAFSFSEHSGTGFFRKADGSIGVSIDGVEVGSLPASFFTDIADNETTLANNTASIATNTTDIATNTSNIATNASAITANATNIATNTSDIATNTSNIAANANAIAANTASIATNSSDIAAINSTLQTSTTNKKIKYHYHEWSTPVQTNSTIFTDMTDSSFTFTPSSDSSELIITVCLDIDHVLFHGGLFNVDINGSAFLASSNTNQVSAIFGVRQGTASESHTPLPVSKTGKLTLTSGSDVTIKTQARTTSASYPTYLNRAHNTNNSYTTSSYSTYTILEFYDE